MACRSRTAETYARISCASLKALACASSRQLALLQALKSLTFKATPLCLLASFLFDKFRFPLDHPFTIVLSARTAHSLTVNHDRNRVAQQEPKGLGIAESIASASNEVDLGMKARNAALAQPSLAGRQSVLY